MASAGLLSAGLAGARTMTMTGPATAGGENSDAINNNNNNNNNNRRRRHSSNIIRTRIIEIYQSLFYTLE